MSILNRKITANKSKHLLIENELNKLKTFDSSYFIGKSHFGKDGVQNHLIFQSLIRHFEFITNTPHYISSWNSKGLSTESIKPSTTSDNYLAPALSYYGTKFLVKFTGSCLKQDKVTFNHKKVVNIYVVYELNKIAAIGNNFLKLQNALFGAVLSTKNADIDKYGYSGYEIGFDRRSSFSFPGGRFGQNILIFGADMSSCAYIDNKKKDILVLGKGPTQGLIHTLTAERIYLINFTVTRKKFCLSLHYNEVKIVICLLMAQIFINLNQGILKL